MPALPRPALDPIDFGEWDPLGSKVTFSHGDPLQENDEDGIWGDLAVEAHPDSTRIGFQNIGGLPTSAGHYKNIRMVQFIKKWRFDVWGMSEINRRWSAMDAQDQFHNRIFGQWESSHVSLAYNTAPNVSRDLLQSSHQVGGNILLSLNEISHRVIGSGQDPELLGRWTWTRYQGKGNITFRVVSAYRPCDSPGALLAWAQQR